MSEPVCATTSQVGGATDRIGPLDPPPPPSPSESDQELHDDEHHHDAEKGFSSAPSAANTPDPRITRTVSAQSKAFSLRKVPPSESSGLLGHVSLLYEAEEPKGYPRKIKWLITFIVAIAAVAAPMGSSVILREQLHSPDAHQCADIHSHQPPSMTLPLPFIPPTRSRTCQWHFIC